MACNGVDTDCQGMCWQQTDDNGNCGDCGACSVEYCEANCTHNCYTTCSGCTGDCDGCWGSCWSCSGTCTGSCSVCTGGCTTYCDAGCANMAHQEAYNSLITIKQYIASEDIVYLRDLIAEEVYRRDLVPTMTANRESVGDIALKNTMDILLDNLSLILDSGVPTNPAQGELMSRTLIGSVRDQARPLYNETIARA